MNWKKLGRVYSPNKEQWWSQHYGILPTPVLDPVQGRIGIYFATADANRFGRVFRLDVSIDDPTVIVTHPHGPLLDTGELGTFDDCGVNPSCVVERGGETRLYYVGFQRTFRVPYLLLSGMAVKMQDGCFRRVSRTPLLERSSEEPWIRSAPAVLVDGDRWRMWYVSATAWEEHSSGVFAGRMMPRYNLRYAESDDGLVWSVRGDSVLPYLEGEFGFGRPWVVRRGEKLLMWYSIRRTDRSYRIGYAESMDGITWERMDERVGIDISVSGWDSEMICYPAVVSWAGRDFLFYNGNGNGETGFGVAVRDAITLPKA